MTEVVAKVKVGKGAPKELAQFDSVGIVEEPEVVLVGWKGGRRRKLGRAAAAQAMKIVGKPRSVTTRRPSGSRGGGGSSGGGISSAEIGSLTGLLESTQQQNELLLSANQNFSSRYDDLETRMGEVVTRLDDATQYGERMNQANQALRSENQDLRQTNSDLESQKQVLERRVAQLENEDPDIIYERVNRDSGDSRFGKEMGRTLGWIGRKMPWRPERYPDYETARIEERNNRRVLVVDEEYYDGRRTDDEGRGLAVVAGGLVLAGLLAWGIVETLDDDGSSKVVKNQTTIIEQNRAILKAENADKDRDAAEAEREQDILDNQQDILGNQKTILKNQRIILDRLNRERGTAPSEMGHGAFGQAFEVEAGNGITNEIQDYARAHGYEVPSGAQSWMIYQNLRDDHGTELVSTSGGADDTYIRRAGDVGISRPGPAKFPLSVEQDLRNRLTPLR